MHLGRRRHAATRRRSRGQSLVELALVTPILLLIFAGAADLGRAFYAYVAIENAAKEGAIFGARNPLCDDSGGTGCADPNNVQWRVRAELKEQGIRNPDGTELTPTVACLAPNGTPHANLKDCDSGDTYQVALAYPFRLLTPILGSIVGNLNLQSTSKAAVLNLAFDPTPGASVQKFVSPTGATNASAIIAKCLEPDDTDAAGFYRNPCLDSSTPDPIDTLSLRFEEGTTIQYRIRIGNSGAQSLTGVTVTDSTGATGCTIPSTMAVGYSQVCNYTRTAPTVVGVPNQMDYTNIATIDSAQTLPATSGVTVTVERPPARLRVLKFVSPFALGGDGDGSPSFGTVDDLTVTYRTSPQVSSGTVWFKVIVQNTGGQTATGVAVTDSRGNFPVNGNCPAVPSTLAKNVSWTCIYSLNFSSSTAAVVNNTVSATATNVVTDLDDSHTATLRVQSCAGSTNRTVPNLIGLTKSQAQTAWTTAGFTGTLTDWNGQNSATAVTQSRDAYTCVAATSTMTITRVTTP